MLALSCLLNSGSPDALVSDLAAQQESLRNFEVLRMAPANMTVADFSARVASAFYRWPMELLETELDHKAFASGVQHNLFDGNPDGWTAYVAHVQKKVAWFGTGLPRMKSGARDEAAPASGEATPAEPPAAATLLAEETESGERKSWPWPSRGSTS